jgi:hypothetical protein
MTVQCQVCKNNIEVSATPQQIAKWKAGELIQRAMPNVPKDEREILISGTCGPCFDRMFPPEEDE